MTPLSVTVRRFVATSFYLVAAGRSVAVAVQ